MLKSEVPVGKAAPRQEAVSVAPARAPPVGPRAPRALQVVQESREQPERRVAPAQVAAPELG